VWSTTPETLQQFGGEAQSIAPFKGSGIRDVLERLNAAGIPNDETSLTVADRNPGEYPADEPPGDGKDKLRDLAVGATSGGAVPGAVCGLIGLAGLGIPGLGLFLLCGPLAKR
jgi:hypothetical protein